MSRELEPHFAQPNGLAVIPSQPSGIVHDLQNHGEDMAIFLANISATQKNVAKITSDLNAFFKTLEAEVRDIDASAGYLQSCIDEFVVDFSSKVNAWKGARYQALGKQADMVTKMLETLGGAK
jgi:hypothetical protein